MCEQQKEVRFLQNFDSFSFFFSFCRHFSPYHGLHLQPHCLWSGKSVPQNKSQISFLWWAASLPARARTGKTRLDVVQPLLSFALFGSSSDWNDRRGQTRSELPREERGAFLAIAVVVTFYTFSEQKYSLTVSQAPTCRPGNLLQIQQDKMCRSHMTLKTAWTLHTDIDGFYVHIYSKPTGNG